MRRAKQGAELLVSYATAMTRCGRCTVCGQAIHMMIYRGSRFCCQLCELAGR